MTYTFKTALSKAASATPLSCRKEKEDEITPAPTS